MASVFEDLMAGSKDESGGGSVFQDLTAGPAPPSPADVQGPPAPYIPPPQPPSLANQMLDIAKQGLNWGRDAALSVGGFVSGSSRREFDLPEIWDAAGMENPPRDAANYARQPQGLGMLALGRDDKQKAGIFLSNNPDATVRFDKFDNAIATWGGSDFYLNAPGVSHQDFRDLTVQGAVMLPLATAAAKGLAARGLGLAGRVIGTGVGTATGGAAIDEGARAAGAPEGATAPKAALDFGVGAAFETLAPIASKIAAPFLRGSEAAFVDAAGKPTAATLMAFKEAGIEAERVTADMVKQFAAEAAKATNTTDAARAVAARSLPVPVPQTRGQVTGMASDQMFEDMAQKGAYGRTAETIMKGFRERQQEALRGNVSAIQEQIAGGAPAVAERGQGGQVAQAALVEGKQSAKDAATAAYRQAREAGQAGLPSAETERFAYNLGQSVWEHDVAALPRVKSLLDDFATLGGEGAESSTTTRALFDWRARANNAMKGGNPEEAAAIQKMIRQFDGDVNAAVEGSLLSGNTEAVSLWKNAIQGYKAFKDKWDSPDLIGALTATERVGGKSQLAVAPEAATNFIFGKADLGFASRPELARELARMKDVLGENSAAWQGIREEAWLRFARAGEGPMEGGTSMFSGSKFKSAWDNANMKNAPLMRVLFDEGERKTISQFADVAARTTNPVKGGQNFSNTTSAQANIIQRMWGALFTGEQGKAFLGLVMPRLFSGLQGIRAAGATDAAPAAMRLAPGATGGAGNMLIDELN